MRSIDIPSPLIRSTRVRQLQAQISSVAYLTHDTMKIVVTAAANETPLNATAGQFCTLLPADLSRPRAYSLARSPQAEQPGEYTFFIRLVPNGEFSTWLQAENREGCALELGGPLGNFSLDQSDSDIVCIAGGSGMSAIFSILEQAQLSGVTRDCYFFYGARTQADLYQTNELQEIGKRWTSGSRFNFVPVLSDEPQHGNWRGETGLVVDVAIKHLKQIDDFNWQQANCLLCGPPPMIDAGIAELARAGARDEKFSFDRFEDASSPAPRINNRLCVLCDECLLVRPTRSCIVESTDVLADNPLGTQILPTETSGLYYNSLIINDAHCIRCHACVDACPHDAISLDGGNPTTSLRQSRVATSQS